MRRIAVLCKNHKQFAAWVRNVKRIHILGHRPEIKEDHERGLAWCVDKEGSWVAECITSDVAYPRRDIQFNTIDEIAVTGNPSVCGVVFTLVTAAVKKRR